ncbi:MAG TPA: metallophosphoesterase family protein [Vicinamibacteria bacterium]|nr:metallophosphoesterase family protein [Vicinamibacteria bacterium]
MSARLAVVSDIHGNLPALVAVSADIQRFGVERVVDLGDSLSGPLWPAETAQFLRDRGWPALAGNHERQLLACARERGGPSDQFAFEAVSPGVREWLAARPATMWTGEGILACHGTPASDDTYLLETVDANVGGGLRAATREEAGARLSGVAARLVLCGHSHVPRLVRLDDGRLVLNPGSVGVPAYEDDAGVRHVVANGSPHARYAIVDLGPDDVEVVQRLVAYPWWEAVERARRNGREDYCRWLTGWP